MEEFFHRFASRGYASISWAFLLFIAPPFTSQYIFKLY